MLNWLKRLFCKHDYADYETRHSSGFACISGEHHRLVCKKCGKNGGEYFAKYDD